MRLSASIAAKYTLIVVLTGLLSLAISDLVVKRIGLLRFCFGLKPTAPAQRPVASSAG